VPISPDGQLQPRIVGVLAQQLAVVIQGDEVAARTNDERIERVRGAAGFGKCLVDPGVIHSISLSFTPDSEGDGSPYRAAAGQVLAINCRVADPQP
jgi:hypothetical protein